MRLYPEPYELRREREERQRAQKGWANRGKEYMELRKLMREYFWNTMKDPLKELPLEIQKAIGLKERKNG